MGHCWSYKVLTRVESSRSWIILSHSANCATSSSFTLTRLQPKNHKISTLHRNSSISWKVLCKCFYSFNSCDVFWAAILSFQKSEVLFLFSNIWQSLPLALRSKRHPLKEANFSICVNFLTNYWNVHKYSFFLHYYYSIFYHFFPSFFL